MADLKVEFDLLNSAKKTLTTLTSEFQNIKAQEAATTARWARATSPGPWARSPATGITTGTSWWARCRRSAR